MNHPNPMSCPIERGTAEDEMKRLSRRSFTAGALAAVAGMAGWSWLRARPGDGGIPWPLRRMHEWNEHLSRAVFSADRLAPEFPRNLATMPRTNGVVGLDSSFDPAAWSLRVECDDGRPAEVLSLADIHALPRVEMTTELKCIEGWSTPVFWAGARLSDLAAKLGCATRQESSQAVTSTCRFPYVELTTPDRQYYVGLDIESALHPQTLLCYEMNGKELSVDHGAPLRLAIPLKYGIKNIKRIGAIRFTDQRPADYWAERGYDWYAGH